MSDVKFSFTFLCTKIQKYCNSNLKTPIPIKLALIGSEAYVNCFLRFYVELLSSKSPDWQNYLRFYLIPSSYVNNSTSASPLHKYLASIDPVYAGYFNANNNAGGSGKDVACGDTSRESILDNPITVQELYSKVVSYLKSAQAVLQVPIAEAMVTYKDKGVDDEPSQVFIPFICDAKIGAFARAQFNGSLFHSCLSSQVSSTAFTGTTRWRMRTPPLVSVHPASWLRLEPQPTNR